MDIELVVDKIDFSKVENNDIAGDCQIECEKKCKCNIVSCENEKTVIQINAGMNFKPKAIFEFKYNLTLTLFTEKKMDLEEIKIQCANVIPSIARNMSYLIASITNIAFKDPLIEAPIFAECKYSVKKGVELG